ncbi:hypothetical protein [Deinococcus ficus]|uniref:hypothetical protein n=1 Tax=Deinococcus ficus TaxID=317577 RepID=UPI0003B55750|nr:hypothetical protein [Deinococcus ficus]
MTDTNEVLRLAGLVLDETPSALQGGAAMERAGRQDVADITAAYLQGRFHGREDLTALFTFAAPQSALRVQGEAYRVVWRVTDLRECLLKTIPAIRRLQDTDGRFVDARLLGRRLFGHDWLVVEHEWEERCMHQHRALLSGLISGA